MSGKIVMTTTGLTNKRKLLLGSLSIGIIAIALCWALWPPSIVITVSNIGPGALRQVSVIAGGKTVHVGDIAVGTTARVGINPVSDSEVEITFADSTGARKTVTDGPYLTNGFRGRVDITMGNGQIVSSKDNVH